MIKRCQGCGQSLQNKNQNSLGYVKEMSFPYCERCFKLNNYNQGKKAQLQYTSADIIKILNQKANYVIFVADFITLNEEIVATFKKIQSNKCLVINKIDLIPKDLKFKKIKDHLKNYYQIDEDIYFLSALKDKNLEIIKNLISNNNSTYIAGYTNSGKSSLINSLLQRYTSQQKKITVGTVNNTTLDFLRLKMADNFFYDSPGFNLSQPLEEQVILKKINTKKRLKPRTYQIKEEVFFELENLFFLGARKNSLTFYLSNELGIKKRYELMANLKEIEVADDTDLVIKGLGFINIKKKGLIKVSSLDWLEIRDSIFK